MTIVQDKFIFSLFARFFIKNTKKIGSYSSCYFRWSVIVLLCHACCQWLVSLETEAYWQGGFTEDEKYYYKEHCLSQKGKHLWGQIDRLYTIARNVCSTYNVTYCIDKSCCSRRYKHLPFQCEYNDNVTISSYVKGNYDLYDVEQIEEFIAWKGAFELASLLENIDDSPYKYEVYGILKFCFDNYKDENGYILEYFNRCFP